MLDAVVSMRHKPTFLARRPCFNDFRFDSEIQGQYKWWGTSARDSVPFHYDVTQYDRNKIFSVFVDPDVEMADSRGFTYNENKRKTLYAQYEPSAEEAGDITLSLGQLPNGGFAIHGVLTSMAGMQSGHLRAPVFHAGPSFDAMLYFLEGRTSVDIRLPDVLAAILDLSDASSGYAMENLDTAVRVALASASTMRQESRLSGSANGDEWRIWR